MVLCMEEELSLACPGTGWDCGILGLCGCEINAIIFLSQYGRVLQRLCVLITDFQCVMLPGPDMPFSLVLSLLPLST